MLELTMEQIQASIARDIIESVAMHAAPPAEAAPPTVAKRPRSKSVDFASEVDGEYPPLSRCVSSCDCLLHGMFDVVFELCFEVMINYLIQ